MAAERNHALDGLRACAALLIVAFHLGLTALVAAAAGGNAHFTAFMKSLGSSGVDLFFTLSAVMLLRPYHSGGRPLNVRQYFWRRLKRLWPPFLGAWLLAGVTVAIVSAHPTWWPSAMPAFNWSVWGTQAFIAYLGNDSYNFAWWTLTIEVAFYLAAPALVALLARRSARAIWAFFIASIALAEASAFVHGISPATDWAIRFLSFGSCFAGGIVLASQGRATRPNALFVVAGMGVVMGSLFDKRVDSHIGFGLIYLAMVSYALDPTNVLSRWLSRPGLVWLGERSYSLFLTHYSVIALSCWSVSFLFGGKTPGYFLASRGLAVIGALVTACVLFEGVERRFANGLATAGQWWPRRMPER